MNLFNSNFKCHLNVNNGVFRLKQKGLQLGKIHESLFLIKKTLKRSFLIISSENMGNPNF